MRYHQPTTIAILGADTVVGRALGALLENSGYDTTPLDAYPTGVVDELLDGADLLLLVPRLDEGVREAFLGAMGKSTPQKRRDAGDLTLHYRDTGGSARGGSPERAVAVYGRGSRGPDRSRSRCAGVEGSHPVGRNRSEHLSHVRRGRAGYDRHFSFLFSLGADSSWVARARLRPSSTVHQVLSPMSGLIAARYSSCSAMCCLRLSAWGAVRALSNQNDSRAASMACLSMTSGSESRLNSR